MARKAKVKKKDLPRFTVHHKHLHPHNSSRKQRHGSKYATVAFVKETLTGTIIASAISRCNTMDEIKKGYGSTLARMRALEIAIQQMELPKPQGRVRVERPEVNSDGNLEVEAAVAG